MDASVTRPAKRLIDDEESTNDQPAVKSVKRGEEPAPCSKVVELQQKLLKSEEIYQRSSLATREAELRADAAERKLDSKTADFEEKLNAEQQRGDSLERENEALKTEMAEMRKARPESELAQENKALKTEMIEMKKEHEGRMDELMQQVAQYKKTAAARKPKVVSGMVLHENGDPTNILQLCDAGSSEATSFETALSKILSVSKAYEGFRSSTRSRGFGDGWLADVLQENSEYILTHECGCCQKSFTRSRIIHHFVSDKHQDKVRSHGAAVSTAALQYWLDQLKPTPAVMKRLQQKQQEKKDAAAAEEAREEARVNAQIHAAFTNPDFIDHLNQQSEFITHMLNQQRAAEALRMQQPQQPAASDSQPVLAAAAADPTASEEPTGIEKEEIDG